MSSSIFLHFINRELHNSLGIAINPGDAHRAIRICTVTSKLQLLCNISQIYEALFDYDPVLNEIKELSSTSIFLAESSAPTRDEFLEQRRFLYHHDQTRYPMYFDPKPSSVDSIRMQPFPEIGMTDFLENTLSQFNPVSKINPARTILPDSDLGNLAPLQNSIRGTVRQREGRGVTFALFANDLDSNVRPMNVQMPLRRLLSGLYIYHYCNQHAATRMTGYPGITMFDNKVDFPLYDYELLQWVLNILGYWEFETEDRHKRLTDRVSAFYSQEHTHFVDILQGILTRARASVDYEGCNLPSLRHRIQSLIASAAPGNIRRRNTFGNMHQFYQAATETLLEIDRTLEASCEKYMANAGDTVESRRAMKRLLIFTATDVEDAVVYEQLCALTGMSPNPSFAPNFSYFYYGVASATEVFHVRSHAGSVGGSGAIALAQEAIPDIRPDVCLSVGICFGLAQDKMHLGDVVVGQRVHAYEPGKESEEGFISRGPTTAVSPVVFDRLRSTQLVTSANFKTHYGLFLSGEKLSNSEDFVHELMERNPEALAGDMEAHGLAEICQRHNCDFAVIKGVADWGKGKTDDYQRQAAENAISVVTRAIQLGAFAKFRQ